MKKAPLSSYTWFHHRLFSNQKAKPLIISFTLFSVVVAALLTFAALKLFVPPLQFVAPSTVTLPADIVFDVELIGADPLSRMITTDWYPNSAFDCNSNNIITADISFNPGYLDPSIPSFGSQAQLGFHFDSTALCNDTFTSLYPYFRIKSKLLAPRVESNSKFPQASVQSYPFDTYFARYLITATNANTGEHHPVWKAGRLSFLCEISE